MFILGITHNLHMCMNRHVWLNSKHMVGWHFKDRPEEEKTTFLRSKPALCCTWPVNCVRICYIPVIKVSHPTLDRSRLSRVQGIKNLRSRHLTHWISPFESALPVIGRLEYGDMIWMHLFGFSSDLRKRFTAEKPVLKTDSHLLSLFR